MARYTLRPMTQYGDAVRRKPINGSALDNATLQQGEEITIWSAQVPADKEHVWGAGSRARERARAFVDATFRANGNGTGTDGDILNDVDVVIAITDSVQEDTLAKTTIGTGEELNDATSEALSDKPVLPEHAPSASEDRYLELRLRATSSTPDGKEVANDSDVRLWYGVVDRR